MDALHSGQAFSPRWIFTNPHASRHLPPISVTIHSPNQRILDALLRANISSKRAIRIRFNADPMTLPAQSKPHPSYDLPMAIFTNDPVHSKAVLMPQRIYGASTPLPLLSHYSLHYDHRGRLAVLCGPYHSISHRLVFTLPIPRPSLGQILIPLEVPGIPHWPLL